MGQEAERARRLTTCMTIGERALMARAQADGDLQCTACRAHRGEEVTADVIDRTQFRSSRSGREPPARFRRR